MLFNPLTFFELFSPEAEAERRPGYMARRQFPEILLTYSINLYTGKLDLGIAMDDHVYLFDETTNKIQNCPIDSFVLTKNVLFVGTMLGDDYSKPRDYQSRIEQLTQNTHDDAIAFATAFFNIMSVPEAAFPNEVSLTDLLTTIPTLERRFLDVHNTLDRRFIQQKLQEKDDYKYDDYKYNVYDRLLWLRYKTALMQNKYNIFQTSKVKTPSDSSMMTYYNEVFKNASHKGSPVKVSLSYERNIYECSFVLTELQTKEPRLAAFIQAYLRFNSEVTLNLQEVSFISNDPEESSAACQAFYIYLQTGNLFVAENNVLSLLAIAAYYNLGFVTEACIDFFYDHLTTENVCEVLDLATKLNGLDILRLYCWSYLVQKQDEFPQNLNPLLVFSENGKMRRKILKKLMQAEASPLTLVNWCISHAKEWNFEGYVAFRDDNIEALLEKMLILPSSSQLSVIRGILPRAEAVERVFTAEDEQPLKLQKRADLMYKLLSQPKPIKETKQLDPTKYEPFKNNGGIMCPFQKPDVSNTLVGNTTRDPRSKLLEISIPNAESYQKYFGYQRMYLRGCPIQHLHAFAQWLVAGASSEFKPMAASKTASKADLSSGRVVDIGILADCLSQHGVGPLSVGQASATVRSMQAHSPDEAVGDAAAASSVSTIQQEKLSDTPDDLKKAFIKELETSGKFPVVAGQLNKMDVNEFSTWIKNFFDDPKSVTAIPKNAVINTCSELGWLTDDGEKLKPGIAETLEKETSAASRLRR